MLWTKSLEKWAIYHYIPNKKIGNEPAGIPQILKLNGPYLYISQKEMYRMIRNLM